MIIKAEQKNTRQSPRKVRLVANAVKDLSLPRAIDQLGIIEKKGTVVVLKVLRQAIANAVNNHGIAVKDLVIKEITVTEGPRYRRFRAVSRGRAHDILKRTCNVRVLLETSDKSATAPVKNEVVAEAIAPTVEEKTEAVEKKETKPRSKKETTEKKATAKTAKPATKKAAAKKE